MTPYEGCSARIRIVTALCTALLLVLTAFPPPAAAVNIQINADGFGDRFNEYVWSMIAAGDYLYVGTQNYATGTEVWRYSEKWGWCQWSVDGFGDPGNVGVRNFCVWRGHLYAITKNEYTGGEIWRLPLDGAPWLWEQVNEDGFGDPLNLSMRGITVYRDELIVTTYNFAKGGQVWSSPDGTCWERIPSPCLSRPANYALAAADVLGDHLYVGTWNMADGCEIWRYAPESEWENVAVEGFGDKANMAAVSMKTFQGAVYVGTGNLLSGGVQIWRSFDGTSWEQIGPTGLGSRKNNYTWSMAEFEGHLYIGLASMGFFSNVGYDIWRYSDATGLEQITSHGFGDRNNYGCRAIAGYKGHLYFGTANTLWTFFLPAEGCEVWRWDPDMAFTSIYFIPHKLDAWAESPIPMPLLFAETHLPCGHEFGRIDYDTVRITRINDRERSVPLLLPWDLDWVHLLVFPMFPVKPWLREGVNFISIEGLMLDGTPFGGTGEIKK